jgi:pimeloyl-ACP methyl ester carboxylesterase
VTVAIEPLSVKVSCGELAAFRLGPRESAGDIPVLAVHGITSNSRAWVPMTKALDGRAAVVAVDLRGRGDSYHLPGPYGITAHIADLLAVLDRLEIERALIVGHSLGAYITARLAVEHPGRVHSVVLVDGGLAIPGSDRVDPQQFVEAFLGPTLARLKLRFPSPGAYYAWWHEHPAFARSDIAEEDLTAFADHDLVGDEPELRSAVAAAAVAADAADVTEAARAAHRLDVPATLLVAPRGLQNNPEPMQPFESAQAWAAEDPDRRRAALVGDVNHYTITLGAAGAAAVAQAVLGPIAAGNWARSDRS